MPIRSILTVLALVAALGSGCGSEEEPTTASSESSESSTSEPETEDEHETESEHDDEAEHESETDHETGPAFEEFARGGDVPPMTDEVGLYLGNALTGVMVPGLASDHAAWATCTEVGSYAGRSCPISPLTVLKKHHKVEYVEASESECLRRYGPIPPGLRELDRVVIVPKHGAVDSCIDDFAVLLFTNDEGELVAVSTLLGEP